MRKALCHARREVPRTSCTESKHAFAYATSYGSDIMHWMPHHTNQTCLQRYHTCLHGQQTYLHGFHTCLQNLDQCNASFEAAWKEVQAMQQLPQQQQQQQEGAESASDAGSLTGRLSSEQPGGTGTSTGTSAAVSVCVCALCALCAMCVCCVLRLFVAKRGVPHWQARLRAARRDRHYDRHQCSQECVCLLPCLCHVCLLQHMYCVLDVCISVSYMCACLL